MRVPQDWARTGAAIVLVTDPVYNQWAPRMQLIRPGRGPELKGLTGTMEAAWLDLPGPGLEIEMILIEK